MRVPWCCIAGSNSPLKCAAPAVAPSWRNQAAPYATTVWSSYTIASDYANSARRMAASVLRGGRSSEAKRRFFTVTAVPLVLGHDDHGVLAMAGIR